MSYLDRDPNGMYRDHNGNGPGPRLMGADTLMGEDVSNRQEEDLGDIKEIMLDMQTGQIAYAVLSFGGVLNMGDKLFAVPWQALQLDTVNKRFILDVAKEKLENAPGFDKNSWPDMASQEFASEIHNFYDTPQNMTAHITSTGSMMGQGTSSMQSQNKYDTSIGNDSASGQQPGNLNSSSNLSRQNSNSDTDNVNSQFPQK